MMHYSFSKLLTHNLAHKLGQISNIMNSSNSWSLKNTHSVSNPLMNNPAHKLSQISSLLGKRQLVTEKYTPFTKLGDHQKKKIAVRMMIIRHSRAILY